MSREKTVTLAGGRALWRRRGHTDPRPDMDGNYSIMAGARSTLQIRYVGYQQEDIAVNGKNIINVNLKSELEDLDEVVVVGYGAVKKRDLTGSVARVGADKLKERSYTNAMQSLQGQVSGVQITQSQGAPGLAPSIKVRGASSVNAGTTPLYVIDGIPLEDNSNSTGTPHTSSPPQRCCIS